MVFGIGTPKTTAGVAATMLSFAQGAHNKLIAGGRHVLRGTILLAAGRVEGPQGRGARVCDCPPAAERATRSPEGRDGQVEGSRARAGNRLSGCKGESPAQPMLPGLSIAAHHRSHRAPEAGPAAVGLTTAIAPSTRRKATSCRPAAPTTPRPSAPPRLGPAPPGGA